MSVEYVTCLREGAIGGVGAIPGTLCAHFCDVIKMRQQLTGERLTIAIRAIYKGGDGNAVINNSMKATTARKISPSLSNFFAGAVPAVQQKVLTRSTMFLASSASVQFFEHQLDFTPTSAAFVGSGTSGYMTGFIASPWEWQKVLVSQRVNSPAAGKGIVKLLAEAKKIHGGSVFGGIACVWKRMHAAGVRNAMFDSTFFGVKRILEDWYIIQDRGGENNSFVSIGFAYGIAAVTAVTVDYAVDVSVKRIYATGPESSIPSMGVLRRTMHIVSKDGVRIFRGLGVKSIEFGISYMITGVMSPHIANMINAFFKDEEASNSTKNGT